MCRQFGGDKPYAVYTGWRGAGSIVIALIRVSSELIKAMLVYPYRRFVRHEI